MPICRDLDAHYQKQFAERLREMPFNGGEWIMNRLRKVVETGELSKETGRVAYVLRPETLPDPQAGFEWREDSLFNAAEALLDDIALKDVFIAAVKEGHAIVQRKF